MTSRSDGKGDRMWLSGCPQHPRYLRERSDGQRESGRVYPLSEGLPEGGIPPGASYVTLQQDDAGAWRVTEEIPLTGSRSRPSSRAYRSGWDEVYGKKEAAN